MTLSDRILPSTSSPPKTKRKEINRGLIGKICEFGQELDSSHVEDKWVDLL